MRVTIKFCLNFFVLGIETVPSDLVGSTMDVVQEAAQSVKSVLKRCNVYLSQPDGACTPMSSKVSDDLLLVATFIPLAELVQPRGPRG